MINFRFQITNIGALITFSFWSGRNFFVNFLAIANESNMYVSRSRTVQRALMAGKCISYQLCFPHAQLSMQNAVIKVGSGNLAKIFLIQCKTIHHSLFRFKMGNPTDLTEKRLFHGKFGNDWIIFGICEKWWEFSTLTFSKHLSKKSQQAPWCKVII